jgi:hypothetical protein
MNKWLIALLVFSLAVNLAAVGTIIYFAQRPGLPGPFPRMLMEPPGPPDGDQNRPGDRGSGIAAENRQEVRRLRKAYQQSLEPLAREAQQTRQNLMRLIAHNPAASDSIDVMLLKMNKLQGEMEKATVQHLIAMRPFLDEKQWQNLTHMLDNRMREPWPMRPNGPREMP